MPLIGRIEGRGGQFLPARVERPLQADHPRALIAAAGGELLEPRELLGRPVPLRAILLAELAIRADDIAAQRGLCPGDRAGKLVGAHDHVEGMLLARDRAIALRIGALLDDRHRRKHGDAKQRERAEQHEPPVRRPDSTLQGVVDLTHYGLDFSRADRR